MKGRQIQKLNTYLAVAQTCKENIAIVAMIPAMMRNVKAFDRIINDILISAENQATPFTHYAKEKLRIRKEMAKLLAGLSEIIRSYALSIRNQTVLHQFNYTYSELYRMKAYKCLSYCGAAINFLDINLYCFRDVGMKKSSLDELKQLRNSFRDVYTLPRNAISSRISSTQMLAHHFKKADNLLKGQMDTLLFSYSQYPEFCKTYKAARRQVKYGRPKEELKNKIKKFKSAPPLPHTRKISKQSFQLKPLVIPEGLITKAETFSDPSGENMK